MKTDLIDSSDFGQNMAFLGLIVLCVIGLAAYACNLDKPPAYPLRQHAEKM